MRGEWKITRLDLQLTLGYEFASKKQIRYFYWAFFEAQLALEEAFKKGREVNISVSLGHFHLLRGRGIIYSRTGGGHAQGMFFIYFSYRLQDFMF